MRLLAFALVLAIASLAAAQRESDRVESLPNFSGLISPAQYSGYLSISKTKNLHYWFVASQNKPDTDPVVLWLNGGPGCSSLDGYWYENGPLHFDATSDATNPRIISNPYSWNKIANVIYLEAPVGVGFSYTTNSAELHMNDTSTAEDNYQALQAFFALWPALRANPLYVAGESYAGVYVPTLAGRIVEGNAAGTQPLLNLKGVLVGNGVTSPESDNEFNSTLPFLYGHGGFSAETNADIQAYCDPEHPTGFNCSKALATVFQLQSDIDVYDYYGKCITQRSVMTARKGPLAAALAASRASGLGDTPPCTDSTMADAYLNSAATKAAIHVDTSVTWSLCSDSIVYTSDILRMQPIYHTLLKNSIKVLIYSGDCDACVPYTGTQMWTSQMGLQVVKPWHQWKTTYPDIGEQVSGFVVNYESDFTFLTIRGAGHMVPQFKPLAAYTFFQRMLTGTPF